MQPTRKTLVLGASLNEARASNKCAHLLQDAGISAYLYGLREGQIGDLKIAKTWPENECFETVTLYINPTRQVEYYQAIIDLNPLRVIFNPGTENPEFESLLAKNNIQTEEACTLVLLQTNQF